MKPSTRAGGASWSTGGPAEHWLHFRDVHLDGYALVTGSEPGHGRDVWRGPRPPPARPGARRARQRRLVDPRHADEAPGHVMRTLEMLRVALPVPVAAVPAGAALRNFEPGRDDAAWLAQNNAAFADHPEQGAWREGDLDERTREPWFDPSGFLLLEIDGRLAASCWTKVHELHPDRFGEIYVISVHPDFQGRSLGRVMVTQGLEALRRKGVSEAILFVDRSNVGARRLYRHWASNSCARTSSSTSTPRNHQSPDEEGDARRQHGHRQLAQRPSNRPARMNHPITPPHVSEATAPRPTTTTRGCPRSSPATAAAGSTRRRRTR